jgi:hypothetical protein
MAIKTSTFSGWQFSGEDAEAFLKQVNDSTPNLLAQETIQRGEKLAKEFLENGFVRINPKEYFR